MNKIKILRIVFISICLLISCSKVEIKKMRPFKNVSSNYNVSNINNNNYSNTNRKINIIRNNKCYYLIIQFLCVLFLIQGLFISEFKDLLNVSVIDNNLILTNKNYFESNQEKIEILSPFRKTELLVGIPSAPQSLNKRNRIRETWAKFKGNWSHLFLVGSPYKKENKIENDTFGDIVYIDKFDQYNKTLPIKTTALLWLGNQLNVSWIFKTDDDVFLNIPILINLIKTLKPPIYAGHILYKTRPIRKKELKWFVSKEDWPKKHFPTYALGAGYLISNDLFHCFIDNLKKKIYLHCEDVNTGIIANICNIKPTEIKNIHPKNILKYSYKKFNKSKTLLQHGVESNETMYTLWNLFNN